MSSSAEREAILGRVRDALTHGRRNGMLPAEEKNSAAPYSAEAARVVSATSLPAELAALLTQRIEALGDRVVNCSSLDHAWQIVRQEAREAGHCTGYLEPALAAMLGVKNGEAAWPGGLVVTAATRDVLFDCSFSVTQAACGIAETGSLVFVHGPGRPRLGNIAPPVHYAVLMASDLLPDVVDALQCLAATPAGRQVVWITGSSRTADIEGVLVRGAHGPRSLTVLLVAG